jgi:hypothetical protein
MLSSEGSRLSRFILARQTLICRAEELDARLNVLALVERTLESLPAAVTETKAALSFTQQRDRASAEVVLLRALIKDLEAQIDRGWERLDNVLPPIV